MSRLDQTRIELRGPRDHDAMSDSTSAHELVEHCFRHDYGRLVAVLVRRVGVQHLASVEDAVQSALLAALSAWTARPTPDAPSAWLFRAAYNRLVHDCRIESGRAKIRQWIIAETSKSALEAEPVSAEEIRDDLLRMLFVCCDDVIPWESRLVLALKTLCGFSTAEIAPRLFTSEANVYKRLARARERLRDAEVD